MPPYPGSSCLVAAGLRAAARRPDGPPSCPPGLLHNPGLVWLTEADVRSLTAGSRLPVLRDEPEAGRPGRGPGVRRRATAGEHGGACAWQSWQDILDEATELAGDAQILLLIGAWLLGLLAVASLSVLVGGRMADQTRRVGLLKAVGGTPGLVAAVLLAEYVLVALVAAAAGLAVGALTAPLLTESERRPHRQRGHAVDHRVHGRLW